MEAFERPRSDSAFGYARLLPWTGEGGKPCYLHTDGIGPLTRLADHVEAIHLDMATDLLDHVTDLLADLLADRTATPDQLRFAIGRLVEALQDVHRIAHKRGPHITPYDEDQDED